ncbi:hypothetical protein B0I29_13615 [Actinoplanes lutulentus]|uniref:N-acetyltransferase domain-containing protein n=1 Tax=Actinoplanes lutulentus TaxID=1287878 RepID=A0A327YXP0_9ACTN|nr:hypothetical protein B0I29_13615 [Actinoplanes lutulentus]
MRASESLFAPQSYPRRFLSGDRGLRPLHLMVSAHLALRERRWTGQVAVEGNRVIALAQCVWDPADPESPTVRVNVADAQLGSGLGRRVMRELIARCLSIGLSTFTVDYAGSNITVDSMLQAIAAEAGEGYSLSGVTRGGIGHLTVRAAD